MTLIRVKKVKVSVAVDAEAEAQTTKNIPPSSFCPEQQLNNYHVCTNSKATAAITSISSPYPPSCPYPVFPLVLNISSHVVETSLNSYPTIIV